MKQLTDANNKTIQKGSTVKYNGGHYWVRSVNVKRQTVNLGPVFGGLAGSPPTHKDVPLTQVVEDSDNWRNAWHKSEAYQSM